MRTAIIGICFLFVITGCSTKTLEDLEAKLGQISSHFVPISLTYSSTRVGDPCAGVAGDTAWSQFLNCQPTLLRAYLATAKAFYDGTVGLVRQYGSHVAEQDAGSSGSLDAGSGDTLHWNKTDENNYQILIVNNGESIFYLSVSENTYTLKVDGEEMDQTGYFEAVISYTSETQWEIVVRLTEVECDPNAVDSPERMKIMVNRNGSLWTGKAMSYHPYYESCTNAVADGTAMNIYTDFVSNDTASSAYVYFMNRTVSDISNISTYALGKVCVNSAPFCKGANTDYSNQVPNPFCAVAPSLTPQWGNTCSDSSTEISTASYLSSDLWIVPSTFHQQDGVSLPTTL